MIRHKAILKKSEYIAMETKFFHFVLKDEKADFSFKPGQFISVKVSENTHRAYSICSGISKLPEFELVIKLIPNGIGSTYFNNLKPGDEIDFAGPFGHFVLRENKSDKVFIATGAGIAPMRAFWKSILKKQNQKIEVIFGYRHEEHGFFLEEMQGLQDQFPDKFSFSIAISQPKTESYIGTEGRVTDVLINKPLEYFKDKQFYICGSAAMEKEVRDILSQQKNVPLENIFAEIY